MNEKTSLDAYRAGIAGKHVLITGGTGSFGSSMVRALLPLKPARIAVMSRDEKKQFDMRNEFTDPCIEFHIGDVRDRARVDQVMDGIDCIFHAAALKQVPSGEYFPMELVKTNVEGSNNVAQSAVDHKVKNLVVLSTDKACAPINVMGMSKALMERVATAAARRHGSTTTVSVTRYGNVLFTRGSVVPFFLDLMAQGKPLTITNGDMTRFMMTLHESLDLVLFALTEGEQSTLYVRKAPAATIRDLADTLVEMFEYEPGVKEIGIRPGEKAHEALITREERIRAEDCGDYYRIHPETKGLDTRSYYFEGTTTEIPEDGYTSENTHRLSKDEIKKLLLSVPEFKAAYESRK